MGMQLGGNPLRVKFLVAPVRQALAVEVVGKCTEVPMRLPSPLVFVVVAKFTLQPGKACADDVCHDMFADSVLAWDLKEAVEVRD